jgi:hypothetical protein
MSEGITEESIVGQLRKIRWFSSLDHPTLMALARLGEHRFLGGSNSQFPGAAHHGMPTRRLDLLCCRFYPRYATVFREGSIGNCFYIVLSGDVHLSSARHLNRTSPSLLLLLLLLLLLPLLLLLLLVLHLREHAPLASQATKPINLTLHSGDYFGERLRPNHVPVLCCAAPCGNTATRSTM